MKFMAKPVIHPYVSPWINEDTQLFRKNVKRFIQEEFVPHEARWREQHRVDPEAWPKAGEVGIVLAATPRVLLNVWLEISAGAPEPFLKTEIE